MICSNYDAFALEEDGRIENQVRSEYRELNLSNPPKFIWANSSQQAREIVSSETEVDMIICMFNEQDKGIFPFASELKEEGRGIRSPDPLLQGGEAEGVGVASSGRGLRVQLARQRRSYPCDRQIA